MIQASGRFLIVPVLALGLGAQASAQNPPAALAPATGETRLSNIRQLTNGGENAEAYWSADGKWITFQSTRDGRTCDQQYVMKADGSDVRRVSTGEGKTTCGWFMPGSKQVFFGSSHANQKECPPRPDPSAGYVWPLDPFDIYFANTDGTNLKRLTNYNTYTAEGVLSPDGKKIVFTSLKDGDLEIYTMNVDGTDVRRLTHTPGYDGGPWWSPDGTKIAYRAHHPQDEAQLADHKKLLAQNLVRPSRVEIFVMNADGSEQRQITAVGGATSPDEVALHTVFAEVRGEAHRAALAAGPLDDARVLPLLDGLARRSQLFGLQLAGEVLDLGVRAGYDDAVARFTSGAARWRDDARFR